MYPQEFSITEHGIQPCSELVSQLNSYGSAFPHDFSDISFLDIGCNRGFFTFLAASLGSPEAVGVDPSKFSLAYCNRIKKEDKHLWLERTSFYPTQPDIDKYDYIMMTGVYHHIWRGNRDHYKILENIKNNIVQDGHILLQLPTNQDPIITRMFPKGEWKVEEARLAASQLFSLDLIYKGETREVWELTN